MGTPSPEPEKHRRDAHRRTAKAKRQARAGDQGAQDLEKRPSRLKSQLTPEGLRIELIEGKDGTFFPERQRAAEQQRTGAAGAAARSENAANSPADRGPHRRHADPSESGYSNWIVGGPRQLCAAADAADGVRVNR